eukprot:CAMPEP_0202895436 /NCGR_PEP_ID=MMETSP1392-20130828/4640_1 /ASSEMBLY_ACC=CAM_ASM_000868 /TAXON_ID=225041 /ORGANISM="Chlamydomonas chlamydogama, Strain SAG 11-48b" /LENGTH=123 /DNA_ID=CAMNT_0049580447 /DNA_START=43 /DNA_END=415 /DNA_ORIENTATION=-
MPAGDSETFWVTFGQASALVGATFGATVVGALVARKNIERMVDPDAFLPDSPLTNEPQSSGRRTRLRPEDVMGPQSQMNQQQQPKDLPKNSMTGACAQLCRNAELGTMGVAPHGGVYLVSAEF